MEVSGLASTAVCSLMCMRTNQSSNASSFKIASGVRNRLNGPRQKVSICGVCRGRPCRVELMERVVEVQGYLP